MTYIRTLYCNFYFYSSKDERDGMRRADYNGGGGVTPSLFDEANNVNKLIMHYSSRYARLYKYDVTCLVSGAPIHRYIIVTCVRDRTTANKIANSSLTTSCFAYRQRRVARGFRLFTTRGRRRLIVEQCRSIVCICFFSS